MAYKGMKLIIFALIFLIIFGGAILSKKMVFDNPVILCKIANHFDEPSTPYYLILDRIYKIAADKNNVSNILIKQLLNNEEKSYYHKLYIRILGVIGKKGTLDILKNSCKKYCQDETYLVTADYIIFSMGINGNNDIIPFLEELLIRKNNIVASEAFVAAALYLLNGNQYKYINADGVMQKYHPSLVSG